MIKNPKLRKDVKIRRDIECYVVYLAGNVFFANHSSYEILKLCNGDRTIENIVDAISQNYGIDRKIAEKDVTDYLNENKILFV